MANMDERRHSKAAGTEDMFLQMGDQFALPFFKKKKAFKQLFGQCFSIVQL